MASISSPRPAPDSLSHWVRQNYGLDVIDIEPLPGERDWNYRIATGDGTNFLLRLFRPDESIDFLQAQDAALTRLSGLPTPSWVASTKGEKFLPWTTADDPATTRWSGLLDWRVGSPWATYRGADDGVYQQIGQLLGQFQQRWQGWRPSALARSFVWDLARAEEVIGQRLSLIRDPQQRVWIEACRQRFAEAVSPIANHLRQSVIHNDANDYNVLVQAAGEQTLDWKVTGLIDFGDMLISWTINDLAIAVAYAVLDEPRPLLVAGRIVRGFHQQWPLTDEEIAVLWSLVTMRLATSICMAAEQQAARPDDPYLSISQLPIQRTLPRLLAIPLKQASAYFRWSIGQAPLPHAAALVTGLRTAADTISPVMGATWQTGDLAVIDWSVDSDEFEGDPQRLASQLDSSVARVMQRSGARWGTGAYGEPRLVYAGDQFIVDGQPFGVRRTRHLGLDLFAPAGAWIYAPWPGRVLHLAEIDAPFDYGGLVVLSHRLMTAADSQTAAGNEAPAVAGSSSAENDSLEFFTVYGHLSRDSVQQLHVGQAIEAGEPFVRLGTAAENGGWPPHLHLQLLASDLGLGIDFPGVATADEWEFWQQVSLDPNLLLNIPESLLAAPEPDELETRRRRDQTFGPSQRLSYRRPLHLVRGWKQYLYDSMGRRFLDAYNNVPHVGHAHPAVVAATCRQMRKLNTNTRYLSDVCHRYLEKLLSYFSPELDTCFLVSSASEANELALRLARSFTNRRDLIVTGAAYHGHTTTLIDISPYKHHGPGGQGAPDWVHEVAIADEYRGRYRRETCDTASAYAALVADILEQQKQCGRPIGAMIAETCPSVAGQIMFPPGYLAQVYEQVHAHGGLMIADEVQTGLGRLGAGFCAFEREGVRPDIVVLGKPIGNGHPLAAVVTRREIATAFDNGMEFFATFGGNTVSCAAGLAVLEVLEQESLVENARVVGGWVKQQFERMAQDVEWIGDVRGQGFFLGLELVSDRETRKPAAHIANQIVNRMQQAGFLWGVDGPDHNVLKFRPPMCLSLTDAEYFVERLEQEFRWLRR